MTVRTTDVLTALVDLERFLEAHRVKYVSVVKRMRQRVQTVGAGTLPTRERAELAEMFGGMGTLNDVLISRANGHLVDDEARANAELEGLTKRLWDLISGPQGRGS